MTIAQQLQQKGIEKGMQQVALNMLMKNMSIDMIEELTGLTQEEIKKIKTDNTH